MTTWDTFNQIHAEIDAKRSRNDEPEPPKARPRLAVGGLHSHNSRRRPEKPRVRTVHYPREGELTLKEFLAKKAREEGISVATAFKRYRAGKYKIKLRRVNPRVIFVREL